MESCPFATPSGSLTWLDRQTPSSSLLSDLEVVQAAHMRTRGDSQHIPKKETISQFKQNIEQNTEDQNGVNSIGASGIQHCNSQSKFILLQMMLVKMT